MAPRLPDFCRYYKRPVSDWLIRNRNQLPSARRVKANIVSARSPGGERRSGLEQPWLLVQTEPGTLSYPGFANLPDWFWFQDFSTYLIVLDLVSHSRLGKTLIQSGNLIRSHKSLRFGLKKRKQKVLHYIDLNLTVFMLGDHFCCRPHLHRCLQHHIPGVVIEEKENTKMKFRRLTRIMTKSPPMFAEALSGRWRPISQPASSTMSTPRTSSSTTGSGTSQRMTTLPRRWKTHFSSQPMFS